MVTHAATSLRNLVQTLATAHSPVITLIANALVDQQIKAVYRILSSDKMQQVISTIQLLTQLVKSGGPPIADMLYRLVVSDFNAWPKLLSRKGSMREKEILQAAKTRKLSHYAGPRPEAIEFIIAIIEAASSTIKAGLVTNRLLTSPILKFLPLDAITTVCNLVRCLHTHILLDKSLPRKAKSAIFNTENLLFRVTSLYGQDDGSPGDQLSTEDRVLFESVARLILHDNQGTLQEQLDRRHNPKSTPPLLEPKGLPFRALPSIQANGENLLFFNGTGGFSAEGKEYTIVTDRKRTTPAPWVNVLANPGFGTVVSESGSAYTWSVNAHEYRLTPWSNDPVSDLGEEAFYIRDEETGEFWSPAPYPARGAATYRTTHGFGYSTFSHTGNGINSEFTMFGQIVAREIFRA